MKTAFLSLAIFGALLTPAIQPALADSTTESIADRQKEAKLTNPLKTNDIREVIGRVIKAMLGLSGALALTMFVYGGVIWMIAGGNPEKIKKGSSTLVWATVGLAVIFASYALVNFAINVLQKSTT